MTDFRVSEGSAGPSINDPGYDRKAQGCETLEPSSAAEQLDPVALRLNGLVNQLDVVIQHINELKNSIGMNVNHPVQEDEKDPCASLIYALNTVPGRISARCTTIHELLAEIETALR